MVHWAGTTLLLRSRASAEGPGAYGESMRQLLMELAIFGFALNAIYGFGQRLLPVIVGSGTPRRGAVELIFWLHNAGVVLLSLAHADWMAFAGPLGVTALAAAAFSYALGMGGFVRVRQTSPRPEVGQGVNGCFKSSHLWALQKQPGNRGIVYHPGRTSAPSKMLRNPCNLSLPEQREASGGPGGWQ